MLVMKRCFVGCNTIVMCIGIVDNIGWAHIYVCVCVYASVFVYVYTCIVVFVCVM